MCLVKVMWKVRIFDEEHEEDLSEKINLFLQSDQVKELKDIKFSNAVTAYNENEQIYCFSALIIYK